MYRSESWIRRNLNAILSKANSTPLLHWILAAQQQTPVLFVGAGLSRQARPKPTFPGAHMKTWKELIDTLNIELSVHKADTTDALWVAEKFARLYSRTALDAKIQEAVPDKQVVPGPDHESLARIPWHTILTLNYDTLLERAVDDHGSRPSFPVWSTSHLARMAQSSFVPVVHLHGHIEHPETIVLTLEDFRQYPQRNAALLTIARQLLLQRPVLFVGFGANDPNFVAWSGWIRDHLGKLSPPWVRLDYREGDTNGDAGMEAYWSPRLQTVPYGGDQLSKILDLIAASVVPLDTRNRKSMVEDHIQEMIEETCNVPDPDGRIYAKTLRAIADEVERVYPVPLTHGGTEARTRFLSQLLKHGLKLAGRSEAEIEELTSRSKDEIDLWSQSGAEVQYLSKVSREKQVLATDQVNEIRTSLGKHFAAWLLAATRLLGPTIPATSGRASFSATEEFVVLSRATDPTNEITVRELGIAALRYALSDPSCNCTPETLQSWFGAHWSKLSKAQHGRIRLIVNEWALKTGSKRDPDSFPDDGTANWVRHAGYVAAMAGDFVKSGDCYTQALSRSHAAGESDYVQYLTAWSASTMLDRCRTSKDEVSRTRALDIRRRLDVLAVRAHSERLDTVFAQREQAESALRDTEKELVDFHIGAPESQVFRARSHPLSRLLEFYERHWIVPNISADIVDAIATAQWEEGDLGESIRLLSRFGREKLGELMRAKVLSPRDKPLQDTIISEVRKPVQFSHSKVVQMTALTELASELPNSSVDELLDLSISTFCEFASSSSRYSGHDFRQGSKAIGMGLSISRYATWSQFRRWLIALESTGAANDAISREQISDAKGWTSLPLVWWSQCTSNAEDWDKFFDYLFRLAVSRRGYLRAPHTAEMLSAHILSRRTPKLSEQDAAVAHLRAWIGDGEPQNESEEWVRSDSVIAVSELGGVSRKKARAARSKQLEQLLEQLLSDHSSSVDPYVIQAWLQCKRGVDSSLRLRLLHRLCSTAIGKSDVWHSGGGDRMRDHVTLRLLTELPEFQLRHRELSLALALECSARSPASLAELCYGMATLSRPLLEIVKREAGKQFAPRSLVTRTNMAYAALGCLSELIRGSSAPSDVPPAWIYSACSLSTSSFANVCSYTCSILSRLVVKFEDQWGFASATNLLDEIRLSLLRAASDGRAYVVGAALRALRDCDHVGDRNVRKCITHHPDVVAFEESAAKDGRCAIHISSQDWTRTSRKSK